MAKLHYYHFLFQCFQYGFIVGCECLIGIFIVIPALYLLGDDVKYDALHYILNGIGIVTRWRWGQRYEVVKESLNISHIQTPGIYICNHQSGLDLACLGSIFPKRCVIVAKRSLKYVPILGQFLSLSGSIFIDRNNHHTALETMLSLAQTVKHQKVSVFLFVEGTRSETPHPTLLPFKKGAFHLSLATGLPIIPVVLSNTHHLFSSKLNRFQAGSMKIQVLNPIHPHQFSLASLFMKVTYQRMLLCLQTNSH